MGDIVAVRKMDDEDCAEHYDDDADGSNAEQRADQYRDASGELSQSDQIADGHRHVHEGREALRAWSAEHSEKYRATVEDKRQSARDAHDEELEIQFAGATCQPVKSTHEYLLWLDGDGVSKETWKSQEYSGIKTAPVGKENNRTLRRLARGGGN
jgi:hypothetical protein